MGFARGPIFQLVPIDLSAAGTKDFHDVAGVVSFVRAEDAAKAEVLGAKVSVMLGDVVMDPVPLTTNSIVRIRKPVSLCKFTWEAQAGVTAYILVSASEDVMIHSPPSRQLVTQSMASALSASAASIGTSAALVAAANGSRQKLTLKNNSASATLYLGADNTVTTASGFPLGPGEGFTFEGTTGAVWAIASAAATDVRILAEG